VSVHGGMLTMAGSWWEKKVITPYFIYLFLIILSRFNDKTAKTKMAS
jgi:hypothetical protein